MLSGLLFTVTVASPPTSNKKHKRYDEADQRLEGSSSSDAASQLFDELYALDGRIRRGGEGVQEAEHRYRMLSRANAIVRERGEQLSRADHHRRAASPSSAAEQSLAKPVQLSSRQQHHYRQLYARGW
ncbi:hypothetical protein JCM10207_005517 [Rhodosporidiobolus poonsookiae]